MPSGISLSASVLVGNNQPVDAKYGPYASTAAALADIPVSMRYQGLTVGISAATGVKEYWFRSGTGDVDLVEKVTAGSIPTDQIIEDTYSNLMNLYNSGSLITGKYYKITDFRLTWWDYTENSYVGPDIPITSGLTNGGRYLLRSKGTTTDSQLGAIGATTSVGSAFTYNGAACQGSATVVPVVLGQEIRADQIEPLIIFAATNRQFASVAYSTIHPEDIIYYEFNTSLGWGNRFGVGFSILPNSRGWIYRRIGHQYTGIIGEYKAGIVDAPYDWRHMTFSCRRMDLSSIPEWTTSGTYQPGQIVRYREKLFTPTQDNTTGRYNENGFLIDSPPDYLRQSWDSGRLYAVGDEVWYVAKPGVDTNATALAGAVKHYRKTSSGAAGVLPTDSSVWTEASLLSDFDWFTRIDPNGGGREEINTLNFWSWIPLSPFVEGRTYFPTSERQGFGEGTRLFHGYTKIGSRLPNDETPFSMWGVSNGSGTPKYSQFYGKPRLSWNWDILDPNAGAVGVPWDYTTRAQKPTFASDPTSNAAPVTWSRDPDYSHRSGVGRASAYVRHSDNITLGSLGNVFYGYCSYINIPGPTSSHNVFKGGFSGITAKEGFSYNLMSTGDTLTCGYGFYNNKCAYRFEGNKFGDSCAANIFGSVYRQNTTGNRFQCNVFGWGSSNNIFGNEVIYNLFAGLVDLNIFENVIAGNKLGFYTSANTVGSAFTNNELKGFARSIINSGNNNKCSYIFWNNIISENIDNCKFYNFQKNSCTALDNCDFTGEAVYNRFYDEVAYLTAGNYFTLNSVGRVFGTTVGASFAYNNVEPNLLMSVETLTASALYGNSYHKRLVRTSNNSRRVVYFDGNGAQQSIAF
jgi:hypothetical protein